MSRKSLENQLIGAVVALAFAMWLLSVIWVYLVIGGAIALAAGLGWLVFTRVQQRTTTPHLVEATTAPRAPPPQSRYHVAAEVDPDVFDDPTRAEVAALGVFGAWSRPLPMVPNKRGEFVRSLELRQRMIGRLVTECEGRHAVWHQAPYGGRKKLTGPPVLPDSVDPWTADEEQLRKQSRHYASCETCGGQGRLSCTTCGGGGRLWCSDCCGEGKVVGYTANGAQRLLNCKNCRGRGDTTCSGCTRGRVACPTCHGKKKLDRWLQIEESVRQDIQLEPDGAVTRAFSWGQDGAVASREEIAADATIAAEISSAGRMTEEEIASRVPNDWVRQHWNDIQPELQPGERTRRSQFTLLGVPSVEVTYGLSPTSQQTIDFEGLRLLAPPVSVDEVFRGRARRIGWLRWALPLVPAALGLIYLSRGAYYLSPAVGGLVGGLTLACAAVYAVIWNATLGRTSAKAWLAGTLVPLIAAVVFALVAEPSIGAARSYVQSGEFDSARRELAALGDANNAELAPLWADLHLAEAQGSSDWEKARAFASKISPDADQYRVASEHADALLAADIEATRVAGRLDDAARLLGHATASFASSPAGRKLASSIQLGEAATCLKKEQWQCALERAERARKLGADAEATDFEAKTIAQLRGAAETAMSSTAAEKTRPLRIDWARDADRLWSLLLARTGEQAPKGLAALRATLTRDLRIRAKEVAKRQAKQARAEKKRQAKAARARARAQKKLLREERRRERQEKARSRRSRSCCKYCSKGCPCGNSCISCSKTCRRGPGCAC